MPTKNEKHDKDEHRGESSRDRGMNKGKNEKSSRSSGSSKHEDEHSHGKKKSS